MGQTLLGTQINNTYPGLLKSSDNGVLGATEKVVGDGLGNDSTLSLGTTSASFTGTLDLASATVVGLPGGAPGLVAGGQTDAMKSAAALTTNPATTLNAGDIAIGENATVNTTTANLYSNGGAIAIGRDAEVVKQIDYSFGNDEGGISIGVNARAEMQLASGGGGGVSIGQNSNSNGGSVAIGYNANADGSGSGGVSLGWNSAAISANTIAIGKTANSAGYNAIAIGESAEATAGGFRTGAISMGSTAKARAVNCITIGNNAVVDDAIRVNTVVLGADAKAAQYSTALGYGAFAVGEATIALGDANASGNYAIAIGDGAQANNTEVVAIGRNVTAINWTSSTTVNQIAFANYAGLNFADDTAAATGGVPLGGVYHNAGALRIRIV